jgi:hypothetical protein
MAKATIRLGFHVLIMDAAHGSSRFARFSAAESRSIPASRGPLPDRTLRQRASTLLAANFRLLAEV